VPVTASLQIVIREVTAERRARVAAAREAPPIEPEPEPPIAQQAVTRPA
jgi:hypothetical protein